MPGELFVVALSDEVESLHADKPRITENMTMEINAFFIKINFKYKKDAQKLCC